MPPSSEKRSKLNTYARIHGDWILELTPEEALEHAARLREHAEQLEPPSNLAKLCDAVQFEVIADCLADQLKAA